MKEERDKWNEKYRSDDFDPPDSPTDVLQNNIGWLPRERALDIATGTGRNALFLSEHGYDVDAIDISGVALDEAREKARERGVDVNLIKADVDEYVFPEGEYDLIVVSFYYNMDRFPDIKEALSEGGVLVYEHHLRSSDPVERGPKDNRYRFRSNDLLHACLDLTVLHYSERTVTENERRSAIVSLIARRSSGGEQSYPDRSA
ncbi:MAG: class I SAM-dependent methyltransferase [Halobacteria archaeon]|nr:class I SAM-dependent methyltransferase [Halobacteria archaeon]